MGIQIINPVSGGAADPSQIVSSTLPTTRVNPSTGLPSGGAALQNGDRWYDLTTRRIGFWNGTLWLTQREDMTVHTGLTGSLSATSTNYQLNTGFISLKSTANNLLFIHKTIVFGRCGTCTNDNRWEIVNTTGLVSVNRGGSAGTNTLNPSSFSTTVINNQAQLWTHEQDYNVVLPLLPVGATEVAVFNPIRISATKFGTAPNLSVEAFSIEYSRVMS